MYNCIFSAHCTEVICDKSCPALVETSYLLERNEISMSSFVFREPKSSIDKVCKFLDQFDGKLGVYVAKGDNDTVKASTLLTYCAICKNWQGSRLHCNVYNLKYSSYLEDLKQSWNARSDGEDLEYKKIWTNSSKILIVSNFDYVNFGDFESQTLLNLIQYRQDKGLTTILVTPPINSLISTKKSSFFDLLKNNMSKIAKAVKL